MDRERATDVFQALASDVRLDVFRLLVRRGPDGMVAGEIASQLDIAPANLSFHLKVLTQAELVSSEQEGRFQRYRAAIPLMLDVIAYLTEECCAGAPDVCADFRDASAVADALLPPLTATRRVAR